MPTYEYRCPRGHTFELFQKMSDEPVATCPECGEEAERVISGGAGLLFKGEGFYITDYRSKEYKEKAKAEKPGGEAPKTKKDSGGGSAGGGGKDTSSSTGASSAGGGDT
ncbi:MAG TPA: zinc ribbon domain-containing protein [Longimicrobiales bacterium]|nr:zinc ribbon domain-containing protein [Longimicrobiales bacterium]